MKNEKCVKNDITNETKKKLINETWIIIGGKKKWIRICPKCHDLIYHKNLKNRNQSKKKNKICRKCKDTSQLKGKFKNCLNCNRLFYAPVNQEKRGWSKFCSIKCNNDYRKVGQYIRTNEILIKQSLSGRKRRYKEIIEKCGQIHPNFNSDACKFIDKYGKQNNYNFQHAMNGGEYYIKELGYWVDGYDKEKNVVLEYNEPHHYRINKNLNYKDKKRLYDIKQFLNCKIIIYNTIKNEIEML